MTVPAALLLVSTVVHWPSRPGVLGEYALQASNQHSALHVGSSPGRRVEFRIDFGSGSLYNFLRPAVSDDAGVPVGLDSAQNIVANRTLYFRTGSITMPFAPAVSNELTATSLSHHFGKVTFCHGYVFVGEHVPGMCTRHAVLAELTCSEGVDNCFFGAMVYSMGGHGATALSRQTVVFSMTSEETVIPHQFANKGIIALRNASVLTGGDITIDTNRVIAGGSTFIIAYRQHASALEIRNRAQVTLRKGLKDDVNSEAIAYTILLILVLGYWVQTSQPVLTMAPVSATRSKKAQETALETPLPGGEMTSKGRAQVMESVAEVRTTRFVVGNTSFSLLVGALISISGLTTYSHQYSPIETDIVLGDFGASGTLFIPTLAVIINLFSFAFVTLFLWHPTRFTGPVQVALRAAFEIQLLLNLVLTIPPPAGQAFRLAIGAFCGSLLAFILGRDGCTLCLITGNVPAAITVLFVCLFCSSFIAIIVDLIAPIIWALRMASLSETLVSAAAWSMNVCATGAMVTVFKVFPEVIPTQSQLNSRFRTLKASTKFL